MGVLIYYYYGPLLSYSSCKESEKAPYPSENKMLKTILEISEMLYMPNLNIMLA